MNQKGLTLLEILIGLAIGSFIMLNIISIDIVIKSSIYNMRTFIQESMTIDYEN
jgi:prepilin-type N-terminal cleavage/methylation domain-containing protein